MRPLVRLGVWGFSAIIAIGVAVLAGRSEIGAARASAALAALRTSPMDLLNPEASKAEAEVKNLAETVKALTDDRDRLAARVASLEQSLTDLTGSIARQRATGGNGPTTGPGDQADVSPQAATAANPTGFPPASASDATPNDDPRSADPTIGTIVAAPQPRSGPLATIQSYVSAASATQSAPASRPAPTTRMAEAPADTNAIDEPVPKGIAVELAIATNVNALRARWGTLKSQHPALLENLKPLVAVRPSARPGFTEFHLVAGPIPDAAVAGRLCGALTAAHIPCRPAPYDGQSLELR